MPVILIPGNCWTKLFSFSLAQSSETAEKTPWDDEDGDDEKLKALAKKFEEKYVSSMHLLQGQYVFLSSA